MSSAGREIGADSDYGKKDKLFSAVVSVITISLLLLPGKVSILGVDIVADRGEAKIFFEG